jgi:hypothetical protein
MAQTRVSHGIDGIFRMARDVLSFSHKAGS